MFNAPAPDFDDPAEQKENSLEDILEATEHAETAFAPVRALPDFREPLENNFFDDDESLEFS